MGGKLFDDLKQSIEDMGAHLRGENIPGITLRTMEIRTVDDIEGPEIKEARHRLGVSQATLAAIIGVSKKTVEAWEAGSAPSKPALRIIQLLTIKPELMQFLVSEKVKKAPAPKRQRA